jgi:uncharacterized protein YggT (Ycf19 family)
MNLADFLLNLAGLLLWVSWRSAGVAPAASTAVPWMSRPSVSMPARRHWLLAALVGLLAVRAWFCWRIGMELDWIGSLDLGVIVLPFNSASLQRMLLYSALSFLVVLAVFYLWLLLLSMVNHRVGGALPLQRFVRQQLGWMDRWPAVLKLVGPWVLVAALWFAVNPLLVQLGMAAAPKSTTHCWQQGAVLGAGTILAWKYLVAFVLFLHVLNTYLYLGNHSFWSFINATAHNLLRPLRWLPLRLGRVDLAPVAGIAVVLFGLELGQRGLTWLFGRLPL